MRYIVAIRYARIRRFLAQDEEGWHTASQAKAQLFRSRPEALAAVNSFDKSFRPEARVQFSILPCRPDGVPVGS